MESLFCSKMHATGIDDFDNVGVSLFSAFNMLVLGVFEIDTVGCLWCCCSACDFFISSPFVYAAVYQVRAEPGCIKSAFPVFNGLHSNRSPEPPHW